MDPEEPGLLTTTLVVNNQREPTAGGEGGNSRGPAAGICRRGKEKRKDWERESDRVLLEVDSVTPGEEGGKDDGGGNEEAGGCGVWQPVPRTSTEYLRTSAPTSRSLPLRGTPQHSVHCMRLGT